MKKLGKGIITGIIFVLALCSSAWALPVGTIMPEEGRMFVGVKLSFDERDLDNAWKLDRNLYLGEFGYSVTNKITVFLHAGLSDPDVTEYAVDNSFAVGLGARGVIVDQERWRLNGFFEYLWSGDHDITRQGIGRGSISANEWQIGVTAQTDLENISPYVGIRYSDVSVEGANFPDQDANDNVGFLLGVDIPVRSDITFNVEGHLVDERGVSIGMTYYLY